ncbi:metal-dependent hydrolase [Candidatus Leptofilum sp.]|uniref:metal-dependent hydrolase n=1 Tax=Candidatus Leptofilum sp. TaxID=3241576 RepID=UPI003B5A0B2D
MAQAGMHGLVGVVVRRWMPGRKWLPLGIVLGNLLPDADNLAVAVATVTGGSTEGLHRTFTHSLFFVLALVVVFWLAGVVAKRPFLTNLGLGLGLGVLMHVLLDLLIWFNGIEILWPLPSWVNLWEGVTPPEWFAKLLMPLEMLFFAAFFYWLSQTAQRQGTNLDKVKGVRVWTAVQLILFLIFTVLVYTLDSGFMTIYGAVYLLTLIVAAVLTIQMQETIEVTA